MTMNIDELLRALTDGNYRASIRKKIKYNTSYPEYRRAPQPNVHKYRGYVMFRAVKTFGVLRDAAVPENKPYLRPKRTKNYLPQQFDDVGRGYQMCWKEQGKSSKQWEPGVSRKAKHLNIKEYVKMPPIKNITVDDEIEY